MVVVESAGLTDVGKKRKGNEDSLFWDDDLKLYVVADGMGGHLAGEVASELVVKTIQDYMRRFKTDEAVEELEDSDKTLSRDANRLASAINLSNRVVYEASRSKTAYRGMGSTVSAVYFTDDTLVAANVGDSPIYLIRKGEIETLSISHTVMAEQMALNPGGNDLHFGQEYSHMLTRAMGVEETVRPDLCEIQCFRGDILVIASDGLSNKVRPDEILELVTARRPAKSCRMLVDMANERGGEDNITLIVLRVRGVQREKGGIVGRISRFFRRFRKNRG